MDGARKASSVRALSALSFVNHVKHVSTGRSASRPRPKSDSYLEEHEDGQTSQFKGQLERAVFHWVPSEHNTVGGFSARPADYETVTAQEVAEKFGCPQDIIRSYVTAEIMEEQACMSLPFTLILVISYACMVIQHMDGITLRAVEDSVRSEIRETAVFSFDTESHVHGYRNIDDVNTRADFWTFASQGIVPLFFNQGKVWSEDLLNLNGTTTLDGSLFVVSSDPLDARDGGLLVNYNRVVGGLRLRQERSHAKSCAQNELATFYSRSCTDRSYNVDPDMLDARQMNADESRTEWLWLHQERATVEAQLRTLELSQWLDDQTQKIEIGVPVWNGEYGIHALVTVNFYFSRGGMIYKNIISQSCWYEWYRDWTLYCFDFLYIGSILWIMVSEIKEMISIAYHHGWRGIYQEYPDVWKIIDWVSVVMGFVLVSMGFQCLLKTGELNEAASDVSKISKPIPAGLVDVPESRVYMEKLESAVLFVTFLQRSLSYYPLVIVFRLFKAFHAQPRLSLVTLTMKESLQDVLHFLIVFCCVFLGFVTSGVVLFGRDVDEFASLWRGSIFCVRILLGDIDYAALMAGSRVVSGLWLINFIVVVAVLLMNILLSIVLDAYSVVKAKVGSAQTLLSEANEVMDRTKGKWRGEHVSLHSVLRALKHMGLSDDGGWKRRQADYNRSFSEWEVKADLAQVGSETLSFDPVRRVGSSSTKRRDVTTLSLQLHTQVIFAQDLCDMVAAWNEEAGTGRWLRQHAMSLEQANEIFTGAIQSFYSKNKETVEKHEYVRLSRVIDARVAQIANYEEDRMRKVLGAEPTKVRRSTVRPSSRISRIRPEDATVTTLEEPGTSEVGSDPDSLSLHGNESKTEEGSADMNVSQCSADSSTTHLQVLTSVVNFDGKVQLPVDSDATEDARLQAVAMESLGLEWSSFKDVDLVMLNIHREVVSFLEDTRVNSAQEDSEVLRLRSEVMSLQQRIGGTDKTRTSSRPNNFAFFSPAATGIAANDISAEDVVDRLPLLSQAGSSPQSSCRATPRIVDLDSSP
mmetsp:Transcript_40203/g.106661  ORF Transcript_40203/g.106661 Transcript_40203/m.106661 type:complete len:1033 (-) Transcript_40203:502-3600(-)|eukprot:CAMPEP_0194490584 /NCGR_PEP_ID=MMETSP0253-20130528/9745_1 /TAXON_ID=2966 /ORGANISM="Noctiluca scintillans" /LENGTH=1032 /DNA_ID=CAMNT_0039331227 /DNA_START=104 /DNA_END=3202 /DNA_ORIENTATION=-